MRLTKRSGNRSSIYERYGFSPPCQTRKKLILTWDERSPLAVQMPRDVHRIGRDETGRQQSELEERKEGRDAEKRGCLR
ncbi:hypothetical protein TNCV_3114631 [Trichonephila clavipes]|nr:hypothetical protein TNCV_3114631 [Trichonephila clavipes]